MNEDDEMEIRENEAIADFYSTIITLYSAQIEESSFVNDEIILKIVPEVILNDFLKQFSVSYIDYLMFDKTIEVIFQQGEIKHSVQIN